MHFSSTLTLFFSKNQKFVPRKKFGSKFPSSIFQIFIPHLQRKKFSQIQSIFFSVQYISFRQVQNFPLSCREKVCSKKLWMIFISVLDTFLKPCVFRWSFLVFLSFSSEIDSFFTSLATKNPPVLFLCGHERMICSPCLLSFASPSSREAKGGFFRDIILK